MSKLACLNHFSPTLGIPMVITMASDDNSNFTLERFTCFSCKLRMKSLVSSGWLCTYCTLSQKWKHPTFWKHVRVIEEALSSIVFWGSNLLILPPLCWCLLGTWPSSSLPFPPSLEILTIAFETLAIFVKLMWKRVREWWWKRQLYKNEGWVN